MLLQATESQKAKKLVDKEESDKKAEKVEIPTAEIRPVNKGWQWSILPLCFLLVLLLLSVTLIKTYTLIVLQFYF